MDIVGWIMAWLPEGSKSYNFEFFQDKSIYYLADSDEEIIAFEAIVRELASLLEGKIQKYGMRVVDGYTIPVLGRANAS